MTKMNSTLVFSSYIVYFVFSALSYLLSVLFLRRYFHIGIHVYVDMFFNLLCIWRFGAANGLILGFDSDISFRIENGIFILQLCTIQPIF